MHLRFQSYRRRTACDMNDLSVVEKGQMCNNLRSFPGIYHCSDKDNLIELALCFQVVCNLVESVFKG